MGLFNLLLLIFLSLKIMASSTQVYIIEKKSGVIFFSLYWESKTVLAICLLLRKHRKFVFEPLRRFRNKRPKLRFHQIWSKLPNLVVFQQKSLNFLKFPQFSLVIFPGMGWTRVSHRYYPSTRVLRYKLSIFCQISEIHRKRRNTVRRQPEKFSKTKKKQSRTFPSVLSSSGP